MCTSCHQQPQNGSVSRVSTQRRSTSLAVPFPAPPRRDGERSEVFSLSFLPLSQRSKLCRRVLLKIQQDLSWKGPGIGWMDTELGKDAPPRESQDARMNRRKENQEAVSHLGVRYRRCSMLGLSSISQQDLHLRSCHREVCSRHCILVPSWGAAPSQKCTSRGAVPTCSWSVALRAVPECTVCPGCSQKGRTHVYSICV